MMLSREMRDVATAAFRGDSSQLALLSQNEQEQIAQWCEQLADLAAPNLSATAHSFHEGDSVTLREGYLVFDLQGSEHGVVWALYNTQPPAYEVTWQPANGFAFDAMMFEDELAPVSSAV